MNRINFNTAGIYLGFLWAIIVFVLGLLSIAKEPLRKIVDFMSQVYIGYEASLKGSFAGALWGFVDGYITGVVFALITNLFIRH